MSTIVVRIWSFGKTDREGSVQLQDEQDHCPKENIMAGTRSERFDLEDLCDTFFRKMNSGNDQPRVFLCEHNAEETDQR